MTDWSAVVAAAEDLRVSAADVDYRLGKASPNDSDLAGYAAVFVALSEARGKLDRALDLVGEWVAADMDENDVEIEDVALLHRSWRKPRKEWKNDELRRDVIAAARAKTPTTALAVDPQTGEFVHTWEQAEREIGQLWYLSGSNVRIGQLKTLGIDPADYCSEGPWRAVVEVVPFSSKTDVASDEDRAGEEIE